MGGIKMARYGMLIDIDRCNGCYNCYMACRDEFEGNDYLPYSVAQPAEGKSWMKIIEKERGSTPKVKVDYICIPCLQCSDAPCVNKSSDGAVYRRPDGIVIIDPEKAKGNKDILLNCPHRLIYWNEEKDIPQKCTFCAHLLDKGWKEPRCVEACPDGALVFGDLDDPSSEISRLMSKSKTEELNPEFKLRPNVRYIDLPKIFIAGEIVLGDKTDECAAGIKVYLSDGAGMIETQTDSFGDFEFDGLKQGRTYNIRVEHKGYLAVDRQVVTYSDTNLGVIELDKKEKKGERRMAQGAKSKVQSPKRKAQSARSRVQGAKRKAQGAKSKARGAKRKVQSAKSRARGARRKR
jgi:Fe-S-cluster-containing dehydrogenase component